jgi:hypothetical protein
VPPVIITVSDPLAAEKGGYTYNAECALCGELAWLHGDFGRCLSANRPPLPMRKADR